MDSRKIYPSPAFKRRVKKLRKQQKAALDDAVLDILNNPKAGEEKKGDLAGIYVHKFRINKQEMLLSYTFTDSEINLIEFGSHENFYRDLKKRPKSPK